MCDFFPKKSDWIDPQYRFEDNNDSCPSRDSFESWEEPEYDEPLCEVDLYYDLEDRLFDDFMSGVSVDKIKKHYDEEICNFSKLFLDSHLGVTLDEHFERLIRSFEHRSVRFEEENRDPYLQFYSDVTYLIFQGDMVKAKSIYDAGIWQHFKHIPDGVTPDAYFLQFVEDVGLD